VIRLLLLRGAQVSAFDPVAGPQALQALRLDLSQEPHWLERFELAASDMQALEGADALMVLTEWKNFHNPDFEAMKGLMRKPFILDGRNLYNPVALSELGVAYQGVGRRNDLAQRMDFGVQNEAPTPPEFMNA
jgi:UDPglucose 6-dehydrogenase